MNWLDIFCFISVVRTRSFSVSARELMISQQAVSRHIQSLEEEIGFPLFLRNYHEIYLSRAGEQMLQCLTRRESLVRNFVHQTQGENTVLRVGWSQWLGCPVPVQEKIRAFARAHPGLTILTSELDEGELMTAIDNRNIDLLLTTNYTRERLALTNQWTPLMEEPLYLIFRQSTPLHDRRLLPYLLHLAAPGGEADEDAVKDRVRAEYTRMGLLPRQIEVVDNPRTVYLNVLLKDGVAFTPRHRRLTGTDKFLFHPLDRTVTVVLCRLVQEGDANVTALERFLLQEGGA